MKRGLRNLNLIFLINVILIFTISLISAGGGGDSGGSSNPACTEDWDCTGWSDCINDEQTRTCTDNNECGTSNNKLPETQSCIVDEICADKDGTICETNENCNIPEVSASDSNNCCLGTCDEIIITSTCNDSDAKNYYVQGVINNPSNNSIAPRKDYCTSNKLSEYYCDANNNINSTEYICPHGCLNGTCLEKQESINLKEGWNLVSFSAFKNIFNKSTSELNNLGLEAIYVFDKTNNNNILIHPSTEETEYLHLIESSSEAIINTAIWVYTSGELTHSFKSTQSFPANLDNVNLKAGWNFLTFTPNMTGNSLNDWIGNCEVKTASIWSEKGQGWDTADESKGDFDANLPSSLLWKGLVLEVYNDCNLENPEIVSPIINPLNPPSIPITPGDVCTDTDRGNNLLEKGVLSINGIVKNTDFCINNETLKEYSCHFTNGIAEGIDIKNYDCNCTNGACVKPNANNNLIETDIEGFIFSNILIEENCALITDSNCSKFIAEYDLPTGGFNSLITVIEDHYLNNFTNHNFTELGNSFQGTKYSRNYNENPVLEIENETSNLFLWYNNNKTIEISITNWDKTKVSKDNLSVFIESYLTKYHSDLYFNNVTECTDFDGGVVYNLAGNCIDKFGTNLSDSCINEKRIREIECINHKCIETEHPCYYGCEDNKCKTQNEN